MKLIQLTDIHLTNPGSTIGGRDSNANFEHALNHALTRHPDAEAVVITGDLSDWGERDDYIRLREILARQTLPVHIAIGNHDDRPTFLEVFPELADGDGHIQSMFPLSDGTGIVIDTWGPESHAGFFCKTRAAWFDRALAEAAAPAYIFMHHNPIPTHIGPTDQIMLLDTGNFGAVVAKHREKIAHIFFGHCHMPLAGSFYGVPTSAPRGTNHAGFPNYEETELLTASDLPEAYAVIIADGPSVTVIMVEYGYDGELRIEGSPDYAAWDKATAR